MDDNSDFSPNDEIISNQGIILSQEITLNQTDTELSTILRFLSNEITDSSLLIENLRKSLLYIRVDKSLFKLIMPPLKSSLMKALDDNFLMAETCDDDFLLDILKNNLQLIFNLIDIVKDILKSLVEYSFTNLACNKSVAVTSIQVMYLTFDHCNKSPEPYKTIFSQDLLEIFKIIEEAHSLFFQLFESNVTIPNCSENSEAIEILLEVLDNVCDVSEILYTLNFKLLVKNWKGYFAIVQKFLGPLKGQINIKRPITNLIVVIQDSFETLLDSDSEDLMTLSFRAKRTGFLVKVALKIFDTFWDDKQKILNEIFQFCCMIYSFPLNRFTTMDCPLEIITLLKDMVFANTKSFVAKLLQDDSFTQTVSSLSGNNYSFGLLNFLNACLECLITIEKMQNSGVDVIIRLMFNSINICFQEFLRPESIFEDLVINISGVVMIYDEYYKKIELILLENVLQEHIWNYFLATEVWCLLLRNADPRFCADTLTNLIKIYNNLEFGNNTYRLEKIYLKYLMQRVYRLLPDYLKCKMNQSMYVHTHVWKNMDFQYFPIQKKYFVENIYQATLEKIDEIGTDKFAQKDFTILAENLESLSTVNFREMHIDPLNLVNALQGIWELTFTDTDNNNYLFRYFIAKVFKITSTVVAEFNNKQLYTILNQLARLSSNDFFKLPISLMIISFGLLNPNELGQDGCKIFKMISNIITNLLSNSEIIIKQSVLDVLDVCEQNGKQSIVRDVVMNCDGMQILVSNYLKKSNAESKFDEEYFKSVGTLEYSHNCIEWKKMAINKRLRRFKSNEFDNFEKLVDSSQKENVLNEKNTKRLKRFKSNEFDNFERLDDISQKPNVLKVTDTDLPEQNIAKKEVFKYSLKEYKYKPYKKKKKIIEQTEVDIAEADDTVHEVLVRLKGEVKCLTNVLKTEKMSAKNVSDLKIIGNQLLSLI